MRNMQAVTVKNRNPKYSLKIPKDDFKLVFPEPFFYVVKTFGRKFTDRELYEIDQVNEDVRIEMNADGDFEIMPPTFPETSVKNFEIYVQLGNWAKKNKTGVCIESSGKLTLPNGAKRVPDAAWILKDRYYAFSKTDRSKKFIKIAPDFVIELRSDSDRLPILRKKMQEYIENGVRLAWLIDPIEKRVHVYRANGSVDVLEAPKNVSGEDVLKGFVLDLGEIL